MRIALWTLTAAGSILGIGALLFGIFGGGIVVQMGAMACVGIALGLLPYLLARAWDELTK